MRESENSTKNMSQVRQTVHGNDTQIKLIVSAISQIWRMRAAMVAADFFCYLKIAK